MSIDVTRTAQEQQWESIKRSIIATVSNLSDAQSQMAGSNSNPFFLAEVRDTAQRLATGFNQQIINNPNVDKAALRAYIESVTDNVDPISEILSIIDDCQTVANQITGWLDGLPQATPAQSAPVQNTIQSIKDTVTGF